MVVAILGTWVGTSLWVGLDASRHVWSNPISPGSVRLPRLDRPWKWALAVFLVWPIVFPAYVYRRADAPLKPPAGW